MTTSAPLPSALCIDIADAQSMMVRVRNPKKSNLTRPAASTSSLSNWVTGVVLPSFAVERREIREHRRRDHDAAGMRARVPGEPFQRASEVYQLANILVAVVQAAEFFLLRQRLVERDADFERNELRNLVHVSVVVSKHPAHIAHHRLRRPACRT